jgi:hypothetical protein
MKEGWAGADIIGYGANYREAIALHPYSESRCIGGFN